MYIFSHLYQDTENNWNELRAHPKCTNLVINTIHWKTLAPYWDIQLVLLYTHINCRIIRQNQLVKCKIPRNSFMLIWFKTKVSLIKIYNYFENMPTYFILVFKTHVCTNNFQQQLCLYFTSLDLSISPVTW